MSLRFERWVCLAVCMLVTGGVERSGSAQTASFRGLGDLPGEPFWSIEETTLVPALWQETAAVLQGP